MFIHLFQLRKRKEENKLHENKLLNTASKAKARYKRRNEPIERGREEK